MYQATLLVFWGEHCLYIPKQGTFFRKYSPQHYYMPSPEKLEPLNARKTGRGGSSQKLTYSLPSLSVVVRPFSLSNLFSFRFRVVLGEGTEEAPLCSRATAGLNPAQQGSLVGAEGGPANAAPKTRSGSLH